MFHLPLPPPTAVVIGGGMSRALHSLAAAGLPAGAPVAVGGHSLGGVMLQDWTFKNKDTVAAQVLMGCVAILSNRVKHPAP
jgi:alpha-beta hydrolase superfamily lysophospholipase